MNELALCAGIGGISLGLKRAGFSTVCYVENAPYPVSILKARMRDGQLDDAPLWDDVTTFDGTPWRGCVDIVTAGFPCQPFSVAGKHQGESDERYLWPSIHHIVRTTQPRYVFLENVRGLLSMDKGRACGRILADLAVWLSDCGGGRIECLCLRASDVGAPHRRERVYIVAYPYSAGLAVRTCFGGDTCQELASFERSCRTRSSQWLSEPTMGRMADGVPYRVERLTALGNAVVPQVAEWVGHHIYRHATGE